jgi:hypothetical protein
LRQVFEHWRALSGCLGSFSGKTATRDWSIPCKCTDIKTPLLGWLIAFFNAT